ncbi:MAG: sulfatase [Rhodopirellula sp.]|nr:sulfatase [Rhodopirellula sp.]OUX50733.1 MAG: sulfatase [Rhodopirellula sp. TMED283]
MQSSQSERLNLSTRRQLFQTCGVGLGKAALASIFAEEFGANSLQASETISRGHHHPPRVKRVIYLFMAGAPSQLDLFDHKPKLTELEGQPLPASVIAGQRYAFIQPDAAVLAPRFKFNKHGESGAELSEVLPHLATIADDLAIIRTVHTDQFNHSPAQLFMNTGSPIPGRPAMGSWLTYGIGSDSADLPGFVVLKSGGNLSGGAAMWSSGFLPGEHQGVPFRSNGDPILNVSNPQGITRETQRDTLDLIAKLNQQRLDQTGLNEITTRMASYEMAYRMQTRAPELMDLKSEDATTLRLYGTSTKDAGSFAKNCLLARRLAERGVRFIQLYHSGWDHHSNVENGIKKQCKQTDQACTALIKDLKQRGMLKDTLVVWGGEFGRTPMVEASAALGRQLGRDHHPQAFSMWMAGGGIRSGQTIGKTDELGFRPIENPIHVHDIQATILHQLGINHEKLTFTYAGRPFRLTDVHGHVIRSLTGSS